MTSNHEEILFYFDILFSRLWVFLSAHNPINHEFCYFLVKMTKCKQSDIKPNYFQPFKSFNFETFFTYFGSILLISGLFGWQN